MARRVGIGAKKEVNENKALTEKVEALTKDNEKLSKEVENLTKDNKKLSKEVETLKEKIKE